MKTPDELSAPLPPPPERDLTLPAPEEVRRNLELAGTDAGIISLLLQFLEKGQAKGARTYADLAKLLGKNSGTLSKVFRGAYPARMDSFGRSVAAWLRLDVQRDALCEVGVLPTSVRRNMATHFDLVRTTQTMGLVFGRNQTGKTHAAKAYTAENPDTYYVRVPGGGNMAETMGALAEALGGSRQSGTTRGKQMAIARLNGNSLLIVDEFHQTLIGSRLRMATIETIREIHDVTGCGVSLIGTDVMPRRFEDARFAEFLGQIANRGNYKLCIPREPTRDDLRLVREAYGFPPLGKEDPEARKALEKLANTHGLGRLCKTLAQARQLAQGEPPTWEHFLATIATNEASALGIVREEGGAE